MEVPVKEQPETELPFEDRIHAGEVLAARLAAYRGQDVLILGIPRGGVPVAAEVAERLDADLDVVVARKLGAPGQPELAIGAVTANAGEFLNEPIVRALDVPDAYIAEVRREQTEEARRRESRFRGDRPPGRMRDRIVIVVDDGLATGATMRAAVRSVRKHQPKRLVVAVPVGSREACADLRDEADEVVCVSVPEPFGAVGYFYRNFEPVVDAEVERILREFFARQGATTKGG
jgi:predicted phosphoribosyltransferase